MFYYKPFYYQIFTKMIFAIWNWNFVIAQWQHEWILKLNTILELCCVMRETWIATLSSTNDKCCAAFSLTNRVIAEVVELGIFAKVVNLSCASSISLGFHLVVLFLSVKHLATLHDLISPILHQEKFHIVLKHLSVFLVWFCFINL